MYICTYISFIITTQRSMYESCTKVCARVYTYMCVGTCEYDNTWKYIFIYTHIKSDNLCVHPQFSTSICIYHVDINTYSPTIAVLALDFFLLYVWNSQREYLER